MLISVNWLLRHVDVADISPAQLALDLTLHTAEVEGVEPFLPHLGQVVIGRVLSKEKHPDADKLSLCKVDVGEAEPLDIVCGAANVRADINVAVAKVGAVLPGNFEIKKSKIRGVPSFGMICSESELGLTEASEGIWIIDTQASPGTPVGTALKLTDWVIDIDNKSLTHRPDLWGHRGIARELSAIYRRPLKDLDLSLPPSGSKPGVPVSVAAEQACSRYCAFEILDARALPSPLWLRSLLQAVGQRSINQLVDISNFVMLDVAQPNHTFDRDKIDARGIVVRLAHPGEELRTLDDKLRKCDAADLLICSGDTPVALAGIMGGSSTEVSDGTSALVLEVATFHPAVIRRTSARHSLRTDASARFEKHLDPTLPPLAVGHFCRLLQALQPDVQFPSQLSDAGAWTDPSLKVAVRPDRVRRVVGAPIDNDQMSSMLSALGFGVAPAGEVLEISVPAARATKDIRMEADLMEEVGRSFGYDNIAEQDLIAPIAAPPKDARRITVRSIQDRLAGAARFHEVISYSFHKDELLDLVGTAALPHVTVSNPVADGESKMRRSVVPSLLAQLEHNRRNFEEVRVFEIGKGYLPELSHQGEPKELHQVGLVWSIPAAAVSRRFDDNQLSRLHGVLEDLIRQLDLPNPEWGQFGAPSAWLHPAQWRNARWGQNVVAEVGTLAPKLAAVLGLKGRLASDTAVAFLSIDELLAAPPAIQRYRPIPKYPGIKVDVAVAVSEEVANKTIVDAIARAGGKDCADIELFDVYQGDSVGLGKKSLAYHVLLRSPQGTLKDSDQQRFLTRLGKELTKLGAQLRDG